MKLSVIVQYTCVQDTETTFTYLSKQSGVQDDDYEIILVGPFCLNTQALSEKYKCKQCSSLENAIKAAKAEVIALTQAGCGPRNNWLSYILSATNLYPDSTIVGATTCFIPNRPKWTCGKFSEWLQETNLGEEIRDVTFMNISTLMNTAFLRQNYGQTVNKIYVPMMKVNRLLSEQDVKLDTFIELNYNNGVQTVNQFTGSVIDLYHNVCIPQWRKCFTDQYIFDVREAICDEHETRVHLTNLVKCYTAYFNGINSKCENIQSLTITA